MTESGISVLLAVQYDGTDFCGSQIQPGVRTVQGTLTDTIAEVLGERPKLLFASRTDAGVHATRNIASLKLDRLPFAPEKLADVLNAKLPRDVAVLEAREVPRGFHPRFLADRRDYAYRIYQGARPDVRYARFSSRFAGELDVPAMSLAAQLFLGVHDFSEFCIRGELRNPQCDVMKCGLVQQGKMLTVFVSANRFLRRMVCFMVGALIDVGTGRVSMSHIADALKPGSHPNFTNMNGQGLTLERVHYPEGAYFENYSSSVSDDIGDDDE